MLAPGARWPSRVYWLPGLLALITAACSDAGSHGGGKGTADVLRAPRLVRVFHQSWNDPSGLVGRTRVLPDRSDADPATGWAVPDAMVFVGKKLLITDPARGRAVFLDIASGETGVAPLPAAQGSKSGKPFVTGWLVASEDRASLVVSQEEWVVFSILADARVEGPWPLRLPQLGRVFIRPGKAATLMLVFVEVTKERLRFHPYYWTPASGATSGRPIDIPNALALDTIDDAAWEESGVAAVSIRYLLGSSNGTGYLARVGSDGQIKSVVRITPGYEHILQSADDGLVWLSGDWTGTGLLVVDSTRQVAHEVGILDAGTTRRALREGPRLCAALVFNPSAPGEVLVGLSDEEGFSVYRTKLPRNSP